MKTTLSSRTRLLGVLATLLLASPLLGAAVPSVATPPSAVMAPAGMPIDPSAAADIRDIHGPIWIPAWWRPWMFGLLLLAAGGTAVVAAKLVGRRRRRPLSPSERALARLDAAAPLALAGESRLYAEAASDAVRNYLEQSFGLPATHQTTDEFFDELVVKKPPQLQRHAIKLAQFLNACDLAKFSLFGMAREDLTSLNDLARAFVIATVQPQTVASPVTRAAVPPTTRPVDARTT